MLEQYQATIEHLLEELWELQKLVTVTDGAPVSMSHIITALVPSILKIFLVDRIMALK